MARPLRLNVADGAYHVVTRGNERRPIFADATDRRCFLAVLDRTIDRFAWRCLSFCLMDNHVHLLLQTPVPNLPRGMQQLKSTYAQAFNRRHSRVGHLFEGRYRARLIQRDEHMLSVFRYIALNPVKEQLVSRPEAFPWSAHAALAGCAPAPPFLAVGQALEWFGETSSTASNGYVRFVAEGTDLDMSSQAAAIGDASYLRDVLPGSRPDSEIPVREWGPGRPALEALFGAEDRDAAIALAYRRHGYPMKEIAVFLGCHVCTVSRRLRAHEQSMLECKI